MSTLLEDIRYAARGLARTPLFTLAGIAILALGIGLNAVVFGLVDATVLRAAPFAEPERLVHVYQDSDEGGPGSTSFPAYREMAAMTDVFAGVAATAAAGATWEAPEAPRAVAIEFVTASYFPVLGLRTHLGSWFSPEHDRVGAEPVAVVTHRAWQTLFGADPAVVGRTVRLNGQSVTILGVGPPDFNGQAGALITHFWLSISSTPVGGPFQVLNLERPQDHWYQVQARLAPNVTLPEARAAMDGLAGRLAELNPELDSGRDITVFAHADVRFHPSLDGVLLASTTTMLVLASTVLLLGCSNLANLFLVRGFARGPEIAVRSALGAGWVRIARLLLAEALLLAALGGAAGLALAAFAVRFIPSLTFGLPVAGLDVRFDARLIAFGLLAALVTGLLFGLLPALRAARADVAASLRDEGRGRSAGRGLSLLRKGLVVAQVALSLVLVVAAGLLGRSLANAERVDLGFDAERIALLGTSLAQGGVEPADFQIVATEILERIAAVPGVERAALTTRLPAEGGGSASTVVEGYAPVTGTNAVEMPLALVSRGYFETLRIALVAGRSFSAVDRQDTPRVVMVNETAARLY